jgi:hypothetical protein
LEAFKENRVWAADFVVAEGDKSGAAYAEVVSRFLVEGEPTLRRKSS